MSGRGQTQQDYLIGMVLFTLTMVGVFAVVPGIYQPFQDPVRADQHDEADRLADTLVTNASVGGEGTLLYRYDADGTWGLENATAGASLKTILEKSGISTSNVNVTVRNGTGKLFWSEGKGAASYGQDPAATTVRVVRFVDDDSCDVACRLVIRVWS